MTDFIRIRTESGTLNLGFQGEWPPPERMFFTQDPMLPEGMVCRAAVENDDEAFIMHRVTCSELTDEQADHPHLARGALYVHDPDEWDGRT